MASETPNPTEKLLPTSAAEDDEAFAATVLEEIELDAEEAEAETALGSTPLDDRALLAMPTIGHVGRYALKHQLGAGGLGAVHAAVDPLLSRPIAVKTLRMGELASGQRESLEQQLLAEARAAASLNHPNIVTVYDAGLAPEGVYLAMERLKGRDLRQMLAAGWRPDAVQAARIAKRLADALAYAHAGGVVHCDVKPANIFMTGRTQPKLLDFGIARIAAAQREGGVVAVDIGTDDGASVPPPELGSPYYASPEHLRGEPLDARADVYGVGVVLYELLTGRRAFDGETLDAIREAVLAAPVPPAHMVNPKIDAALSGIVARAMARRPGDRYRSARQLSRALRQWISDETNGPAPAHRGSARSAWVWAAGLTAIGAVLVAGWLFWMPSRAQSMLATAPQPALRTTAAAPVAAPRGETFAAAPPPAAEARIAVTAQNKSTAAPPPPPRATPPRAKPAAAGPAPSAAPAAVIAAPAQGQVQLAVSPWGQVEVNGQSMGTTPPLARLNLPVGTHRIVVRNDDFPAFSTTVTVSEDKSVTLRHRFGS